MALNYQTAVISSKVTIAYNDSIPYEQAKGVILLIHGFPQTSYQFHHVIPALTQRGYRVITPDYRGAGRSGRPASEYGHGYTKSIMAGDLVSLLSHAGIPNTESVHVVGTDIGGMVAYAFASRHPNRTRSLCWGECPVPGTSIYAAERRGSDANAIQQFHFIFHCVPGLPEQLIRDEPQVRIYLQHFLQKITYKQDAITVEDFDRYVADYAKPGAMHAAFEVYRAFRIDEVENKDWIVEKGRLKVPTLALNGEQSRHAQQAPSMLAELHEPGTYEFAVVRESAHYVAEEQPEEFVRLVADFADKHN